MNEFEFTLILCSCQLWLELWYFALVPLPISSIMTLSAMMLGVEAPAVTSRANHQPLYTKQGQKVLAFYSHKKEKLSPFQVQVDADLTQKYEHLVCRTHLSNFHRETFQVEMDACLMHSFLAEQVFEYAEQVFQAAKAALQLDAEVLLTYKHAQEVAEFGRGKLPLDAERVRQFEEADLPLRLVPQTSADGCKVLQKMLSEASWQVDGKQIMDAEKRVIELRPNEDDEMCFVVRPFQMREDWERKVRYEVMSHVQKARFLGPSPQKDASLSFKAYINECYFFLEHKDKSTCRVWADGWCSKKGTTVGTNALGKCMTVVGAADQVGSRLSPTNLLWMLQNSNEDIEYIIQ